MRTAGEHRLPIRYWSGLAMALLLSIAHPSRGTAQERGVSLTLSVAGGRRIAVAVLPIGGANGDSIATILRRDLIYSDRYTVLPHGGSTISMSPDRYAAFAKLAIDAVIEVRMVRAGVFRVAMHDVGARTIRYTKDVAITAAPLSPQWRMTIHGMADDCEEWLSGQRGIAQTRIAFERSGRLFVVDSDGANVKPVTVSGMSPQWLPSGQGLVYTVVAGARSPLLYTDLTTGAQRTISETRGIEHTAPAVSPDGREVMYAGVGESGTDLFVQPIAGGPSRRVTVSRGRVSTQPSYSPNGQRVVFISDRSGRTEVYVADVDGANVEMLSTQSYGDDDYRSGPDWSPDGRRIALASRKNRVFQIVTITIGDGVVRELTSEGRNEDPSWAPDSRHLVFTSTRSGTRQLWIVDSVTGTSRQLTFGAEARLAAWSPRLRAQ